MGGGGQCCRCRELLVHINGDRRKLNSGQHFNMVEHGLPMGEEKQIRVEGH